MGAMRDLYTDRQLERLERDHDRLVDENRILREALTRIRAACEGTETDSEGWIWRTAEQAIKAAE